MKSILLVPLLLSLAACAHPPQLSFALDLVKTAPDAIEVKLKVVNLENSVTVPIAIDLTGEAQVNGQWQKAEMVLHPAAFVLNRNEQRVIPALWKTPADAVRTTLVVREQETGNLLKTEKAEKNFGAATAAATGQP